MKRKFQKMYFIKCAICGLKSSKKSGEKRPFMARFPLDGMRCKQWVKATGNEDLVYVPIEKLHQLKHVCGTHFTPKDFNRKRNRLKHNAVPSLNLKQKLLPEEMMKDFPLHVYKSPDGDGGPSICEAVDEPGPAAKEINFVITKEHSYSKASYDHLLHKRQRCNKQMPNTNSQVKCHQKELDTDNDLVSKSVDAGESSMLNHKPFIDNVKSEHNYNTLINETDPWYKHRLNVKSVINEVNKDQVDVLEDSYLDVDHSDAGDIEEEIDILKFRGGPKTSNTNNDKILDLRSVINNINKINSKLMKDIKKLKLRIRLIRQSFPRKAFEYITKKMTPVAKQMTKIQMQSGIKPNGRRYSYDEKMLCLAIYYICPQQYNLLAKMLTLVSIRVLQTDFPDIKTKVTSNSDSKSDNPILENVKNNTDPDETNQDCIKKTNKININPLESNHPFMKYCKKIKRPKKTVNIPDKATKKKGKSRQSNIDKPRKILVKVNNKFKNVVLNPTEKPKKIIVEYIPEYEDETALAVHNISREFNGEISDHHGIERSNDEYLQNSFVNKYNSGSEVNKVFLDNVSATARDIISEDKKNEFNTIKKVKRVINTKPFKKSNVTCNPERSVVIKNVRNDSLTNLNKKTLKRRKIDETTEATENLVYFQLGNNSAGHEADTYNYVRSIDNLNKLGYSNVHYSNIPLHNVNEIPLFGNIVLPINYKSEKMVYTTNEVVDYSDNFQVSEMEVSTCLDNYEATVADDDLKVTRIVNR